MQSQAGGTNFEYEARSASWVTGETYRDGGAWIFGGSPQSPLLTPEQLGYSGTGGSTRPETPTQEPPVPGAEQPHTPESPEQPHTPGSPAQPQAPTSGGEQDWQARAVRMNERLSARLGWGTYTDQIVAHFQQQGWLEPNMSPAPAIFAGAVRQYQQQQSGLAVDGIIGRNTWRTLRRTLGIRPPAETPATPEAPGTTPESPSTPAHEAPSTPAHEAPSTPAHEAPSEPAGEVPAVEAGGNMGAAHPIPLRGLRGIDRQMARIHNDYGSYLAQKAAELGIMVADAAAFLKVESGGRGFDQESGRMIIRFENHLFYRNWGRSNRAAFDQHFRFNRGRGWTGHQFRSGADGEFQSVHSGQESEWTTFEFARGLDAQAAMLSISMGNAQILGSNYRLVGYRSVQEMFDDMSGSLQAQTEGLFTFIARRRGGIIVTALQNHNYRLAARYYNGTGQEEAYGDRIREASVAYARVTTETAEPSH
ncbi:MAG: N-acetylmuramidase domain-containing protein [Anaerolineae bacterium]